MNWIQWPFRLILQLFKYPLISLVEKLKKLTNAQTYQIEVSFVALALLVVWFLAGRTLIEAIGAFAVLMTFQHASVANRLEEKQAQKAKETGKAEVACYRKLGHYFLAKETTWLIYFIALHAWSALVGVFIFLFYYP